MNEGRSQANDNGVVRSPAVGRAKVLAGAQTFKDQGIANLSDTYRGQIYLANGEVKPAIIKDIPLRELANEVMAAALAKVLSIPVPPAFLALASPAVIAARHAPKVDNDFLLFASADVSSPSVAQLIVGPDLWERLRPIAEMLISNDWTGDLYGFDAWAANVDRHIGNILFGGSNSTWIIDHGRCFTGPNWQAPDLNAAQLFRHRLKEWLTPLIAPNDRDRFAIKAAALADRLRSLDIYAIGEENLVPFLLGRNDFGALVEFLTDRVPHVPRAAADALDIGMIV